MGCKGCGKKVKKRTNFEKVKVAKDWSDGRVFDKLRLCPECGAKLIMEGCWHCMSCGWEKC